MIQRILVGLGSEPYSYVATRYAVELAQRHGAELAAIAIIDLDRLRQVGSVPIGASAAAKDLREHRIGQAHQVIDQLVRQFETACETGGVRCRVYRQTGDPFELMISVARYHDLVVCGLKGLFEHGVLDEPPDGLVRLIAEGVRPIIAVPEDFRPVRRVLIAYSGSMESAKTMRRFVQLDPWPNVAVRIVTFAHPRHEATQLLRDATDYCRAHGIEPEFEYVSGSPQDQLLPYADSWQADLIVVGNSAKSLLRRRLFGETALQVIRHADRPLFLCQ
jgi:nucleotide-binding universal stress UspA family protein